MAGESKRGKAGKQKAGAAKQVTRPRANPKASTAEVKRRVAHIADMMSEFRWITRKSARDLSAEWHVAISTVEGYATEASRAVLTSLGDPEQIRARVFAGMDRLTTVAAAKGEFRTAMHGLSEIARLAGLDAPQKVAITDAKGDDLPLEIAQRLLGDDAARLAFVATGRLPAKDG